jgi:hypothetical protein
MLDRALADAVVLVHALFIGFAVAGGILVLRWRWVMGAHLPAVAWAVLVEVMNWPCPLTPLENHFRRRGGEAGYPGGFVEHYVWPAVYPEGLTDRTQFFIGGFVFVVNAIVYGVVVTRWKRRRMAAMEAAGSTPAVVVR